MRRGHVAELREPGGVVGGGAQVDEHPPGIPEELGDVVRPPARVDLQGPPVEALLARALERSPARRFVSAAAMGEACEHYLYDKGYGPTNLTLKHYLASIFGRGLENEAAEAARSHEPTLIPIRDEMRRDAEPTRVVSPLKKVIVRAATPRPGGTKTPRNPRSRR